MPLQLTTLSLILHILPNSRSFLHPMRGFSFVLFVGLFVSVLPSRAAQASEEAISETGLLAARSAEHFENRDVLEIDLKSRSGLQSLGFPSELYELREYLGAQFAGIRIDAGQAEDVYVRTLDGGRYPANPSSLFDIAHFLPYIDGMQAFARNLGRSIVKIDTSALTPSSGGIEIIAIGAAGCAPCRPRTGWLSSVLEKKQAFSPPDSVKLFYLEYSDISPADDPTIGDPTIAEWKRRGFIRRDESRMAIPTFVVRDHGEFLQAERAQDILFKLTYIAQTKTEIFGAPRFFLNVEQ